MKTKHSSRPLALVCCALAVLVLGFSTATPTETAAQGDQGGIAVLVAENRVLGNSWPPGASVTLEIDDPGTLASPDYTNTEVVAYEGAQVWFTLEEAFRVRPGHIVTMSDGSTTKEHIVTSLAVTAGDITSDTIWGTADPGSGVSVVLHSDHSKQRRETADSDGNWLADFSIPGDEPGEEAILDVGAWNTLMVLEGEGDGDHTQIDWRPPLIMAHLIDDVKGFFWPCGVTLAMTIDDPETSQSPDYEETQTIPDYCSRDNVVLFDLLHRGFGLKPGHTITMTDGTTTKIHVVRDLAFSLVNEHTDTVTGRAEPGLEVRINVYADEPAPHLTVLADQDGAWVADFSSLYDIAPGTSLNITTHGDEDGDWTQDEFGSVLAIDIMPGSERNAVSLRSRARIPVAVLTTETFDATSVDLAWVRFGATGTEAAPAKSSLEDVDEDGDTDLMLHFNVQDAGIACRDAFAFLGLIRAWPRHLSDMGADAIVTVGCK